MAQRDYKTTGTDLLSDAGRLISYKLSNRRCPVCRSRFYLGGSKADGMQMDHIESCLSGGGVEANLVALCGSCNASKGAKGLAEWLPARCYKLSKNPTIQGARQAARHAAKRIEANRVAITSALIEAGIWS